MKHLLFSFGTPIVFSVIFSVIFSVTLTACGGGSAGGSTGGLDNNFTPSNDFTLNPLGVIEKFTATDVAIPTYKDGENDVAYDSLTKIADDATTENPIDVTLHGLAVVKNDNINYERENTDIDWTDEANDAELKIDRQVTLSRITSAGKLPAVKLTFGADGSISGVTVYADEDYTNATADRSNIFGFTANYMAHISWNLAKNRASLNNTTEDNIYDISGMMLAGIQTADGDIPISGRIGFTGKGKGVYGNNTGSYNTVFNVMANVDFAARNVTFTFSNTCKIVACADNSADRLTDLDFSTGKIKFAANANTAPTNNISGDVTLTDGLAGKLDARFYGKGEGNFARELGGTFALVNTTNKNYYYGAFGGQYTEIRNYILNKDVVTLTLEKNEQAWNRNDPANYIQVDVPKLEIPTDKDGVAYTSIEALRNDTNLDDDIIKSFTLPLLGTHRYYRLNYQRNDNSIDWDNSNIDSTANIFNNLNSVVTLNYHVKNGNIYFQGGSGTQGIVLYRKVIDITGNESTNRYAANIDATESTYFKGGIIGIDEKAVTNYIHLFSGNESGQGYVNYFGFVPENIVALTWYIAEDKSLLGADNLEANTETNFGRFIAGLETGGDFGNGAFGAIPESGNVTFFGKGLGGYGYLRPQSAGDTLSERELLSFNMVANVDFADKKINFSTYNTCYVATCTIKRKGLDFNVNISFTANNMSNKITTSNGLLTGKLETRFYGNAAQEFGGSFAMTGINDNIYYYGIFAGNKTFTGADRSLVDANKFDSHYSYPKTPIIPYVSFAEAAGANEASQFVVQGSAVQKHDITYYVRNGKTINWDSDIDANVSKTQDISLVRSDAPAIMLNFNADGKISAIEAYFGFNTYTATLADDATGITANGTISNADYNDAETSNITVDRNAFGFKSNYMVYLSWNLVKENLDSDSSMIADDKYNINGMMVAGIDTLNMPTSNRVNFVGAGKGIYGNKDINHAVTFRTFAGVDFGKRTVALNNSETACVAGACTLDTDKLATLNFKRTLVYKKGTNRIAGGITDRDSGLSGVIYARFYGAGENAVSEFGGIFALKNSTYYYYGAFGAVRESNIIESYMIKAVDDITINPAKEVSIANDSGNNAYTSLTAASDDTQNTANKIFTLNALSVNGQVLNNHARLSPSHKWVLTNINQVIDVKRLFGSTASLTFDADGNISAITAHLNGKNYVSDQTDDAISSTMLSATISGADKNASNTLIALDRSSSFFGFNSKYMVHINWNVTKDVTALDNTIDDLTATAYNSNGIMIAGMETADKNIPTQGAVEFISKGRGIYGDKNQIYQTKFDVIATVNFNDKHVKITSRNSCKADNCDNIKLSALNFSTEKIFYTGNDISGAVHAGDLSGVINARFYGGAAEELGGIFAMRSDTNYHYGGFGGYRKDFYDFNDTQDPSLTLATSIAPNHKLYGIAFTTKSNGLLPQILTIQQLNQKIRQIKIDTLDFSGNITRSQDFNKDFSLQDNKALYLNDGANLTLDDNVAGSLRLIHTTEKVNGITVSDKSNWIAVVHDYQNALPRRLEYQTFGIIYHDLGRGGFSTGLFTNNIPTQGTQNFVGRAYGYYVNGGNKYLTRAKIFIDADFDNGSATITTSETRKVKFSGNVSNDRTGGSFAGANGSATDDDSLNFTGNLSYNAKYKWFRGNVTAALGDGEAVMKAYGPNVEEVGGTFRLKNADATQIYAGAFGATIPLDVPDTDEALTLATLESPYLLQGVGKMNNNNNGAVSQTFEIHQSEDGKITQVKLNNVNSNGDITSSVNYNQKLNATTQIYINDGANLVANDDSIAGSLRFIHTNNKSKWVAVVHDYANETWGWKYQTIGLTKDGSFSAGLLTNDLPTGGSASFTGRAYGYYKRYSTIEPPANEKRYLTRAKVTVDINFATGSAFIATSETRITAISNSSFSNRAGRSFEGNKSKAEGDEDFYANGDTYVALNFSGTLTYRADEKQFRGSLNTDRYNNQTKGGAVMKAYGPNVEEVGGTFRIEDVNQGWKAPRREFTYTGAFGAKRDE